MSTFCVIASLRWVAASSRQHLSVCMFINLAQFYHINVMSASFFMLIQISSSRRKLPEDRSTPQKFEFGFLEPEAVRPGRCNMRQALQFLAEHKSDPDELGSAESIARRFNLDVNRVNNVLSHFGVFNVEKAKSLTKGAADKSQTEFSVKVPDMANDAYRKT